VIIEPSADLFGDEASPLPDAPEGTFNVPAKFIELAHLAILHRDPQRFAPESPRGPGRPVGFRTLQMIESCNLAMNAVAAAPCPTTPAPMPQSSGDGEVVARPRPAGVSAIPARVRIESRC